MADKANILIVDDNASQCKTMSLMLRHKGHAVATANDGPEAIRRVREGPFSPPRQMLSKTRVRCCRGGPVRYPSTPLTTCANCARSHGFCNQATVPSARNSSASSPSG